MGIAEIFVIGLGLSMDAFAVSICKGLSMPRMSWKNALVAGAYFGGFQAGMPLLGYLLGSRFQHLITSVDHWIAFGLLVMIGGNMVREALQSGNSCDLGGNGGADGSFAPRVMLPLALSTSVDALAVGITLAFLQVDILAAVLLIGLTTFAVSMSGIKIGHAFGARFKARAELLGGAALILMGIKILAEHLRMG